MELKPKWVLFRRPLMIERCPVNVVFDSYFSVRESIAWIQAFDIFDRILDTSLHCGVVAC
jgi:hypothetical protein